VLTSALESKVFGDLALGRFRHVLPVADEAATGLLRRTYDQMRRDFQLVPPITLHASVPPVLAGAWCVLRETQLAGPTDRMIREAVATTVSRRNACPFCVDVHGTMLRGGGDLDTARRAIRGEIDRIADPRIRAAAAWAGAAGRPGGPTIDDLELPPAERAQVAGAFVAFQYINRMVNVFLEPSPFPVPPASRFMRYAFSRVAGSTFARRLMGLEVRPGESLVLLPDAPVPDDLAFLTANLPVAGAFARMAGAVERAGRESLAADTRAAVLSALDRRLDEPLPLDDGWATDDVAHLDPDERERAHFAVLVALASWRVDEHRVARLREEERDADADARLVGAAAWAAFTAARRLAMAIAPA
jgi:AhpD family alkylhydroperoxidase